MISISWSSLVSQLKRGVAVITNPSNHHATSGMHPGSTSTTPFSVKDILKLERHQQYGNDFMVNDQVFPMRCQPVHDASRDRRRSHVEPCASDALAKLGDHDSAAEEEKFEQGEAA